MVSEVESSDTDQWPASQASEPGTESQAFPTDGTSAKPDRPEHSTVDDEAKGSTPKQPFICTECGLTFRKQDDFDRHRFAHTGVREYRCPEPDCAKEYTNRAHLNRHIRSNHTSKPPEATPNVIRCKHTSCVKTFSTDQSMRRHYDLKHVLGKSWTCQECGERFWRKLQLKHHSFRHTGQYPHQCDHCDKGFMNLKSLRNHRTTHAIHKCDSCTAEFTRWTDLVAHRKLQHATIYQCDICQSKFRSKKNLKAHIQVHQKYKEGDEQEVFQCPYEGCPKFYDYERNLIAHVRAKHEGARKFVCPVADCGRALSTQQKLDQHYRMHESAARSVPRMKVPTKPTARRKDAGVPKRSTASRLANVRLAPDVERILIEQSPDRRPLLELEASFSLDSASESEVESSGRVGAVLEGQLAQIKDQIRKLQEHTSQG
ncbi:transcription factor IIIA-like [Ochlerotatus camptorhynchus]|uniref:transcription factor IIIA-like n=1 Tax=Ochlerotatus camptorhynchus TaxID=644619 RepID=UPI0031D39A36